MPSPTAPQIRPAVASDAAALARIYNHYVRETIITFEEEPIADSDMASRMAAIQQLGLPYIVAEVDGAVMGYAYAYAWKPRAAYRHTSELTIYLAPDAPRGTGLGTALYGELLTQARASGVHVALGGIALPNDASVALHEKLGFEKLGQLCEVGRKFGRWIDVGYWQYTFPETVTT